MVFLNNVVYHTEADTALPIRVSLTRTIFYLGHNYPMHPGNIGLPGLELLRRDAPTGEGFLQFESFIPINPAVRTFERLPGDFRHKRCWDVPEMGSLCS